MPMSVDVVVQIVVVDAASRGARRRRLDQLSVVEIAVDARMSSPLTARCTVSPVATHTSAIRTGSRATTIPNPTAPARAIASHTATLSSLRFAHLRYYQQHAEGSKAHHR